MIRIVVLTILIVIALPLASMPSNPTKCWLIRSLRPVRERSPKTCAVWSARTRTSTARTRALRAICGCWSVKGWLPETPISRCWITFRRAMAIMSC